MILASGDFTPFVHGSPCRLIGDRAAATHQAVVAIGRAVQKQSFILAFSDTFFLLGIALILALVAGLLLKKPDHVAADGAH